MAVKEMIVESLTLEHGWGGKGRSVALLTADTLVCPRTNSGRTTDPSRPCGHRLSEHPTLRLPEGTPVECHSCGFLGVRARAEAEHATARTAIEAGRVIRLDVTRGIYTLGDLAAFLLKLLPGTHIEFVAPAEATVPYEEPEEAAPPKTEVEELREQLAKQGEQIQELLDAQKPPKKGRATQPGDLG